jgi:calcium-dependent protein kinase
MVNIMKYCHENKTAHRDLKPENFMLIADKALDIMLIDFGLCYRWKDNMRTEAVKKEGSLIGTAYYMAPEIFSTTYDERCDIWSLGIILFMLVTGEPPVSGSNNQEILTNIKGGRLNLQSKPSASIVLKQKELNPRLIDLVLRILTPEDKRLSLKEVMNHPWLTMKLPDIKMNISFEKIRKYSKLSKVISFSYSSKS